MKKNRFFMLYVVIVVILPFLFMELLIREEIFLNFFKIEKLRQPLSYCDYYTDADYWKLYYHTVHEFAPPDPAAVHPVLGWSQCRVGKDNPLGLWEENIELMHTEKKKILFYGDSFVRGVSSPDYFIPVYMTESLNDAVVVDLSCGGYGLGQMFLMFRMTHKKVEDPYVFIGLLVDDDLDRSILPVRLGQKPYFIIDKDDLILKGLPIDPDPERYFKENPPEIKSYLFRYLYRGICRKFVFCERKLSKRRQKIEVNTRIIERLNQACKKEGYPLEFVLFYSNHYLKHIPWQEEFIKNKLGELRIPYIDTKTILLGYAEENGIDTSGFYELEDRGAGHHNDLGNKVISEGILKHLSQKYSLN